MKSLRMRFIVLVLVPVIVVFSLIGTYTIVQFYQNQTASALEQVTTLTNLYAEEIENALTRALNVVETISVVVSSQVERGLTNRDILNSVLKDVLLNNDYFFAVWLGMEPNAYDGTDVFYVNTEQHDSTGRFIPLWYRNQQGVFSTFLTDYQTFGAGDYYQLAVSTRASQILEPRSYVIDGEKYSLVTISVPIEMGSRVIGVAGVHIEAKYLQDITASLRVFETGFGQLFTDSGHVVYHPEQARIGILGEEFADQDGMQILVDAQAGHASSLWTFSPALNTECYQTYAPIQIGNLPNKWVLGAVVPRGEMFADVMSVVWRLINVSVVGFVILAILILAVSRAITKPITMVTTFIEKIGSLDLRAAHQNEIMPLLQKKDEVGAIARAAATMQGTLTEVIQQLQAISKRVAANSQEISASVGENSASVEEIASSMGELGSSVTEASDQSVQMADGARAVERLAQDGNVQMSQTRTAMERIVELSKESRGALELLSSQVVSMENVLGIIADVAEQTNLLALNASIEAARAGEHGRGFAVVADEVRGLAEQTRSSVTEIRQMVEKLIANAKSSTELMEGTEEQIRVGNDLLLGTESSFQGITKQIDAISQTIQDFSILLKDMDEMGKSVFSASEQQAGSLAEMAQGAEHLAEMGMELQKLAERFTI